MKFLLIEVEGWIRTEFVQLKTSQTYATYGCGSIMEGKFNIEIHVAQFDPDIEFKEGTHVSVVGQVIYLRMVCMFEKNET